MTHKADPAFTPKCRILREGGGCRFTFFCGICEHRYTTPPLQAENAGEARLKAEADARLHFNSILHFLRCTPVRNRDSLTS